MKQDISVTSGLTIGLDLGDRRSDVCVLDPEGRVLARFKAATSQPGLQKALVRYRGARVVLEVGTHSPWVSRWLASSGFEVIVANPRMVRLIAESHEKSDRFDAEILARLGRVDPALLRPIQHRGETSQRDRALLAVRDGLVRSRSSLVSRARGIAKSLGERLPRCETESFARRMRREGLASFFPGMEELVAILDELTQRIRDLDREIERLCAERYPETVLLRQVAGVGPITALSFVLTLEDPARFVRSRQVGAYVGLRPKKRQSGDRDPQLRISKAGDPFLRRILVQAAHYILGPFGPDTALRRFGERLIARGGRAARKKATVAVARKLAVLLHRLWLTGEIYEPLRGVELDAAA
jgi:transposase